MSDAQPNAKPYVKEALREILLGAKEQDGGELGLGPIPSGEGDRVTYVFVNRQNKQPECWYKLTGEPGDGHERERVHIDDQAIYGYIDGFEIRKKLRNDEWVPKAIFVIDAGERTFRIESGVGTEFTENVLEALDAVDPAELEGKIALSVEPGDKSSVVLPSVFLVERGETIYASKTGRRGREVARSVAEKLGWPDPIEEFKKSEKERKERLRSENSSSSGGSPPAPSSNGAGGGQPQAARGRSASPASDRQPEPGPPSRGDGAPPQGHSQKKSGGGSGRQAPPRPERAAEGQKEERGVNSDLPF